MARVDLEHGRGAACPEPFHVAGLHGRALHRQRFGIPARKPCPRVVARGEEGPAQGREPLGLGPRRVARDEGRLVHVRGHVPGRRRREHDGAHEVPVLRGERAGHLVAEGVAEHDGAAPGEASDDGRHVPRQGRHVRALHGTGRAGDAARLRPQDLPARPGEARREPVIVARAVAAVGRKDDQRRAFPLDEGRDADVARVHYGDVAALGRDARPSARVRVARGRRGFRRGGPDRHAPSPAGAGTAKAFRIEHTTW